MGKPPDAATWDGGLGAALDGGLGGLGAAVDGGLGGLGAAVDGGLGAALDGGLGAALDGGPAVWLVTLVDEILLNFEFDVEHFVINSSYFILYLLQNMHYGFKPF